MFFFLNNPIIGITFPYSKGGRTSCCFQISGKLFDSGPRRSNRLAGESGQNTGSSATSSANGTSHSSKYLGGSKLSSVAFRSVTFRKGQARGSESFDEGDIN